LTARLQYTIKLVNWKSEAVRLIQWIFSTFPFPTNLFNRSSDLTKEDNIDAVLIRIFTYKLEFSFQLLVSDLLNIVTCIPVATQRLGKRIPAQANSLNNRMSIARQWISKLTSFTLEAFSHGISAKWL
jgi:hypothetical protein